MSESVYSYPTGHTYRNPSEIARDMSEISQCINKMEEKLCVHDLLVETLYRGAHTPDPTLIATLGRILEDSRETLARMTSLRESLVLLEEELEVCRCHRV